MKNFLYVLAVAVVSMATAPAVWAESVGDNNILAIIEPTVPEGATGLTPATPSPSLTWETVSGSYVGDCGGYTAWLDLYGHNNAVLRNLARGKHLGRNGTASISDGEIVMNDQADSTFTLTLEKDGNGLEGRYKYIGNSGSCDFYRNTDYSVPKLEALNGLAMTVKWRTGKQHGPGTVEIMGGYASFLLCRGNTGSGCYDPWTSSISVTKDGYVRMDNGFRVDMLRYYDDGDRARLEGWYIVRHPYPKGIVLSGPKPSPLLSQQEQQE